MCILYLQNISIWTSHISIAQESRVAGGHPVEQCGSRIIEFQLCWDLRKTLCQNVMHFSLRCLYLSLRCFVFLPDKSFPALREKHRVCIDFSFLSPKFLQQNPLQSLESTAYVSGGNLHSPAKKKKQGFPLGIAVVRLLYFLAPGLLRYYHSLLTDFNRSLFLIVELMNPISQLQSVRAIPFQKKKRLIWKSEWAGIAQFHTNKFHP